MRIFLIVFLLINLVNAKCNINAYKLVSSYDLIAKCKDNKIYLKNGKVFIYNDGRKKSFYELLNNPDIEDMFRFRYPREWVNSMPKNIDPGRIRFEPLFKELYGHNAKEVRSSLVKIKWVNGKNIYVTRKNGVANALKKIVKELKALPQHYQKYIIPIGGTFKWRNIAGTNRLSVHSFGAAIDINIKYAHYWRWSKGGYKNLIPPQIVKIFEKYGFIWGGKWYHYDTMHFEYRPELLR